MRIKTLVSNLDRQIEEMYRSFSEELGVTSSGLEVLELLFQEDGQQPGAMARQIMRASTSFTPILDNLQNRGLVCRRPHPEDRRAVQIFLTDKGRALEAKLSEFMSDSDKVLRTELGSRSVSDDQFLDRLFAPLLLDK